MHGMVGAELRFVHVGDTRSLTFWPTWGIDHLVRPSKDETTMVATHPGTVFGLMLGLKQTTSGITSELHTQEKHKQWPNGR